MSDRIGVKTVLPKYIFYKLTPAQRRVYPGFLPVQHCTAHQLALVFKAGIEANDYLRRHFMPTMIDLALQYKFSHVKLDALISAMSELLGFEGDSFKPPGTTRWLSIGKAVKALREILPVVVKVNNTFFFLLFFLPLLLLFYFYFCPTAVLIFCSMLTQQLSEAKDLPSAAAPDKAKAAGLLKQVNSFMYLFVVRFLPVVLRMNRTASCAVI
jgi:hypothetical protein